MLFLYDRVIALKFKHTNTHTHTISNYPQNGRPAAAVDVACAAPRRVWVGFGFVAARVFGGGVIT